MPWGEAWAGMEEALRQGTRRQNVSKAWTGALKVRSRCSWYMQPSSKPQRAVVCWWYAALFEAACTVP